MKVNTNAPPSTNTTVDKAGGAQAPHSAPKTGEPKPSAAAIGSSSHVEISDKARLMQKAAEAVRQAPEVRSDRVAALKKSISEGTYRVDSEAVADKLVDEHLQSFFGKNSL